MTELTLANRHPRLRVNLRLLRRIALATLADDVFLTPATASPSSPPNGPASIRPGRKPTRRNGPPSILLRYELACFLVDRPAIAQLNEQHLRHPGPTDVITFDYGAPPEAPPDEPWLRGDIFICLDVARMQAREFRTSWPAELVRYLVHALLHLRGFDDLNSRARRCMKSQEDRLVTSMEASFPLTHLPVPCPTSARLHRARPGQRRKQRC